MPRQTREGQSRRRLTRPRRRLAVRRHGGRSRRSAPSRSQNGRVVVTTTTVRLGGGGGGCRHSRRSAPSRSQHGRGRTSTFGLDELPDSSTPTTTRRFLQIAFRQFGSAMRRLGRRSSAGNERLGHLVVAAAARRTALIRAADPSDSRSISQRRIAPRHARGDRRVGSPDSPVVVARRPGERLLVVVMLVCCHRVVLSIARRGPVAHSSFRFPLVRHNHREDWRWRCRKDHDDVFEVGFLVAVVVGRGTLVYKGQSSSQPTLLDPNTALQHTLATQ
jgi:hypothetical protein